MVSVWQNQLVNLNVQTLILELGMMLAPTLFNAPLMVNPALDARTMEIVVGVALMVLEAALRRHPKAIVLPMEEPGEFVPVGLTVQLPILAIVDLARETVIVHGALLDWVVLVSIILPPMAIPFAPTTVEPSMELVQQAHVLPNTPLTRTAPIVKLIPAVVGAKLQA